MKKRSTLLRIVILAAMLFALMIPSGFALAQDDDDDDNDVLREIFFWVYNESQFDLTLWLYGPAEYELIVPADSEGFFIIKNGWYAFTMESCNLTDIGTIDFTTHKTMHNPICGSTAGLVGQANNHYDTSDFVSRPARIQIRNRTFERIEVYIRTLDEDHFLTFEPMESVWVLFNDIEQEFTYSYLACGELQRGTVTFYRMLPFDLDCD